MRFSFFQFSSVMLKSFKLFHETPFTQMFTKLIHFHFGPSPSQLMTSLGRARILITRSTKKRKGNNWRQLKRERESTSHSFLDRRAKNRNPNREEENPFRVVQKKNQYSTDLNFQASCSVWALNRIMTSGHGERGDRNWRSASTLYFGFIFAKRKPKQLKCWRRNFQTNAGGWSRNNYCLM